MGARASILRGGKIR
uniref:Gag protein n=1 Tax=Human immunodeficiency virus type 1 TaxID=11676 RepID=Q8UT17_HV1|nr:gag protein [Human immunodeficiency virus 1]